MGLRELRYTNLQIAREFRNVCEDINQHIAVTIEENDKYDTESPIKGIEGESR